MPDPALAAQTGRMPLDLFLIPSEPRILFVPPQCHVEKVEGELKKWRHGTMAQHIGTVGALGSAVTAAMLYYGFGC